MSKDEIGKEISVDELMSEIVKDRVFFEESGGGVTFSGGEPLMQNDFLIECLKKCNTIGIHSAVDTSGYTSEGVIDEVSNYANLFLYDLKLMNDDVHEKYTGVSNQIILKNLIELDQLGKKIIIRIPIVPEITDTNENLFAIRGFISYLNNVIEVNLLPYHRAGEGKYIKYGRENKMGDTVSPERKNLENIRDFLSELKYKVKIGG
jgi:pyruvate formate lyase activating enzyme